MNVLYTSQKLHELFCDSQFSVSGTDILDKDTSNSNSRSPAEDSLPSDAHASGDGDGIPGHCCRLCGGDNNLRYFGDTYVWQGVEERYDQLLNDCFGVKVTPSDCMICEWCVRALRATGRFRMLVQAAFDEQNSDLSSSLATGKSSTTVKKAVELATMTAKQSVPAKPNELIKKREDWKRLLGADNKGKRTNVPCDVCKQKYPMLVNARDNYKTFVCSRCKKNGDLKGALTCGKCNTMLPSNEMAEHLDMHLKSELRAKFREHERKRAQQLPKKVLPIEVPKPRSLKYQCSQCSKKYALVRQLAMHVRNAHGDSMDNICCVCNEDMESNEKLQEHLLQHSGLHQCDECLLIFKSKKILAAHVASKHHVGYTQASS